MYMIPSPVMRDEKPKSFAGLHLSGVSANRTAVAILRGEALVRPLRIMKVYERIGTFGSLFSDEQLLDVLRHSGPLAEVFVDCPLSLPPCVGCTLPLCPGVVSCDNVSVAYMLRASRGVRRRGAAKARPLNPQTQRLWDVHLLTSPSEEDRPEPSYSANLAPLVTRAITLQKRLRGAQLQVELKETSIPHVLKALSSTLDLDSKIFQTYRRFEGGREVREHILEVLVSKGWLHLDFDLKESQFDDDPPTLSQIAQTPETFHAAIAAIVAALHHAGLTKGPPSTFVEGEGWVFIPELSSLNPRQS